MSASRAERLLPLLTERELDMLVVTNLMNVRYLTGYTGSNGVCVVGAGVRRFFTDFRYTEQAEKQVEGFELERGKRDLLEDVAKGLSGRVGFEDDHLTVRAHERLTGYVGESGELVAAGSLVGRLRAVKDESELAAMREAAKLADGVYEYLADRGLRGMTERELAVDLEREMRERGAEDPSFPSIVAAGPHGALPHAEPRGVPIERDTLLIVDMGARVDGYCSDCTRTFATGELSEEAAGVYELVALAQREALPAIRAGADCRGVDSVARELIAEAGQGERFGHGLGHGVGLEVHEEPRLSQSADGELAAGNAVTVEPGVYLPGELGVRIEDLVVVTDEGCENLSGFTKELVTLEG